MFQFNDVNRMSQIKAGGTVLMNFVYNGKGEQVRRYLRVTNTYTVYGEAGHWLGDYNTAGAPIQQVVWMDDLDRPSFRRHLGGILSGNGRGVNERNTAYSKF